METLEERQMTIEIQYIVEALIEQYYAANTESKKYFVQLRFVDFVIDNIKNPLCEKIFNVYAPKYAARAKEVGQGGGYTRILKVGTRKGDNADMAIVELI